MLQSQWSLSELYYKHIRPEKIEIFISSILICKSALNVYHYDLIDKISII